VTETFTVSIYCNTCGVKLWGWEHACRNQQA